MGIALRLDVAGSRARPRLSAGDAPSSTLLPSPPPQATAREVSATATAATMNRRQGLAAVAPEVEEVTMVVHPDGSIAWRPPAAERSGKTQPVNSCHAPKVNELKAPSPRCDDSAATARAAARTSPRVARLRIDLSAG